MYRPLTSPAIVLSAFRFSGTYMQEVLDIVWRRQQANSSNKMSHPSDYALLLADKSLAIPLDRTVASLQGKRELSLVRKSLLPELGLKNVGRTTDPNGVFPTLMKQILDVDVYGHSLNIR